MFYQDILLYIAHVGQHLLKITFVLIFVGFVLLALVLLAFWFTLMDLLKAIWITLLPAVMFCILMFFFTKSFCYAFYSNTLLQA